MTSSQVIIIGAGAAGLMAAYKLAKAGQKVTVLEARKRVGGRIHTLVNEQFSGVAETGAEFIHGDLPETLSLLREAGIRFSPAGGEMWHYKNGNLTQEAFMENWDLLMQRLNELQQDITISEFLSTHFPGEEHKELRTEVIRFASGYDNADPDRASTFALRCEWQSDDEDAQHRLPDGYGAMIQYLASSVTQLEGTIHLSTQVKEIKWQPGRVAAITSDGQSYTAEKMVVALPLGILQILPAEEGHIHFNPGIEKHSAAIQQLGFGAVIKVLLQFKTAFWEEETVTSVTGADFRNMGFILSEEAIPTWWTQNPQHSTLLTGWLGGLPAAAHTHSSDEELLRLSLASLSNIFHLSIQFLEEQLTTSLVINWPADPYTRGGYAYDTVNAADARDIMMQPVADTIYFAGEYLYDGPYMGTVEAALTSGSLVARQIVKSGSK